MTLQMSQEVIEGLLISLCLPVIYGFISTFEVPFLHVKISLIQGFPQFSVQIHCHARHLKWGILISVVCLSVALIKQNVMFLYAVVARKSWVLDPVLNNSSSVPTGVQKSTSIINVSLDRFSAKGNLLNCLKLWVLVQLHL